MGRPFLQLRAITLQISRHPEFSLRAANNNDVENKSDNYRISMTNVLRIDQ